MTEPPPCSSTKGSVSQLESSSSRLLAMTGYAKKEAATASGAMKGSKKNTTNWKMRKAVRLRSGFSQLKQLCRKALKRFRTVRTFLRRVTFSEKTRRLNGSGDVFSCG